MNKGMQFAASGAIQYLLNPTKEDKVLILTDYESASIARAFEGCFNNPVDIHQIENKERPLNDIPQKLEFLLPGKTIVLNIIRAIPEEIPFRIKWIFKVKENKRVRMLHMPGITEDIMMNSVNVDFNEMKLKADNLIRLFHNAEQLHITTTEGTEIKVCIRNRNFISDIQLSEGEMINLPCGEIYCAPLETEADGVVVFNASIGDIGLLDTSLKVSLKRGKIIKFESNDKVLEKKIAKLTAIDEQAGVIGELGIGINPRARITGNMLEDEKSLGTAHIAFGNNADFPGGGENTSMIHRDYLFYRPTIEVQYADKTKRIVLKNGIISD